MYSSLYKRIVMVATCLILLNAAIEVWVANAYPFQTGNIWANWVVLTFVPVFGIGAVIWAYLDNSDQKEMLGEAIGSVAATTALAAVAAILSALLGIGNEWVELLWGAFAVNFFVGSVSVGLIYVLVPQDQWTFRQHNEYLAAQRRSRMTWDDFKRQERFITI